jgi:hypothetical protein
MAAGDKETFMKRWFIGAFIGLSLLSAGCASGRYRYHDDYRFHHSDGNHWHNDYRR